MREVVRPIAPELPFACTLGRESWCLSLSLDPPIPKKDRRFSLAGGVCAGLAPADGPLDDTREKPGPSDVCDVCEFLRSRRNMVAGGWSVGERSGPKLYEMDESRGVVLLEGRSAARPAGRSLTRR